MFSTFVRRAHMYLALFLTPWVLMYALSTIAMNHRDLLQELNGDNPPIFEKVKEVAYEGTFPVGAEARQMAMQVLSGLHMEGAHSARFSEDGSTLTINRFEPLGTKRLTLTPTSGTLVIETETFRGSAFLERLHRRRGYRSEYPLEDAWGFSVDLVIVSMIFWAATGTWMWWEMKATRRWGTLVGLAGLTFFGVFLMTI